MKYEKINLKILSYCDIPDEILKDHWLNDFSPDCFVIYNTEDKKIKNNFDDYIYINHPELWGTVFFINIDY